MLTRKHQIFGLCVVLAVAAIASFAGSDAVAQRLSKPPRGLTPAGTVKAGGETLAGTSLSGVITIEAEVISVQTGGGQDRGTRPGKVKHHPIRLRVKEWSARHPLHQMWKDTAEGKNKERKVFELIWTNKEGEQLRKILIQDAWVSGVIVGSGDTATVTLEPGSVTFE